MRAKVGEWVKDKRSGVPGLVVGIYGNQYKVLFHERIANYLYDDEIIIDEAWNLLYDNTNLTSSKPPKRPPT